MRKLPILFLLLLVACSQTVSEENVTKTYCKDSDRQGNVCIEIYEPVCGWFNEQIKCFKYPCAATYSNSCFVCKDAKVAYWTKGECPK